MDSTRRGRVQHPETGIHVPPQLRNRGRAQRTSRYPLPQLQISGRVTDAKTGRPISKFAVRSGTVPRNRTRSIGVETRERRTKRRVSLQVRRTNGHALQVSPRGMLPRHPVRSSQTKARCNSTLSLYRHVDPQARLRRRTATLLSKPRLDGHSRKTRLPRRRSVRPQSESSRRSFHG